MATGDAGDLRCVRPGPGGQLRGGRQHPQRRQRCPHSRRRQPGVEDERPTGVHQVGQYIGMGEHRTALSAEGLRQGHRADHVRSPGQPGRVHRAPAAVADHAERVRFVHHE